MLSRQQKRQKEREHDKLLNRMFTFQECQNIANVMVEETINKYNVHYTLCIANALSAEPFNFGKKRVSEVLNLFFENTEGLRIGTIAIEQVTEQAKKVGVTCGYDGKKFWVDINPSSKSKEYPLLRKII